MLRPGYNSTPTDLSSHSDAPSSSLSTATDAHLSTSPSSRTSPLPSSSRLKPATNPPSSQSSSPFVRSIGHIFKGMMRESKHSGGPGGRGGANDDDDLSNNGKAKGGMFGREGTLFGFPPRILLFFSLLLTILYLTGALSLPGHSYTNHSSTPHGVTHSHLLTPHDYLNASLSEPAPFPFCPLYGPGDEVANRRGQVNLLKTRLHTGTGARVQKVVRKALSGAPLTISVLGASVSACHGAGDDPISVKCYPSKFFSWWNDVFPHPASELTNGATRKMDSSYFAFCSEHHLPDKTDLVILEFDAADPNDPEWMAHYELLVRSILVRPDQPAIIALGHFSPQVQSQHGYVGPELLHNIVAQFYDIPHISVKGLIYQEYMNNPEEARKAYYADPILANAAGHDLIADVLISYMESQICLGWAAAMGHGFDVPAASPDSIDSGSGGAHLLGGVGLRKGMTGPGQSKSDGDSTDPHAAYYAALRVPSARLGDRPSDVKDFREVEPFCVSANDLINPLPPSLFYGSGWHAHHPEKGDNDDKHYWYAEQPTSRLRVPVKIGAGEVGIYYLQSPEDRPLGNALCWVDDNVGGGVELSGTADVYDVVPTLVMIDKGVGKGSHFIECQLMGEEGKPSPPFKILGIFTT
ncbi:hypothetical protein BDY24DRAFT_381553 [Mrakia frigida]|uniref:SGNH/GDSL hydrolase family protein n=1 Tax=Mrakia frigida TaxID=29902 RepID=UPI003FCBF910